jgi:hypothetical protein
MRAAAEQTVQPQTVEHLASSSGSSSNGTTGTSFLRSHLLRLAPYTPIEPFEILSAKYGRSPQDIVKLDANENPYGPPPEVREALAAMPFPHIYPDPETRRLRKALADWNDIPMENLLVSTVLAAHPKTSSSNSSFCNRLLQSICATNLCKTLQLYNEFCLQQHQQQQQQ